MKTAVGRLPMPTADLFAHLVLFATVCGCGLVVHIHTRPASDLHPHAAASDGVRAHVIRRGHAAPPPAHAASPRPEDPPPTLAVSPHARAVDATAPVGTDSGGALPRAHGQLPAGHTTHAQQAMHEAMHAAPARPPAPKTSDGRARPRRPVVGAASAAAGTAAPEILQLAEGSGAPPSAHALRLESGRAAPANSSADAPTPPLGDGVARGDSGLRAKPRRLGRINLTTAEARVAALCKKLGAHTGGVDVQIWGACG